MGLLRRDRPGRHRHVVRARDAAHARDRAPRPGGDRGGAARASPSAHRDTRDARPHARPARAADHVRLQGRGVGGRGPRATASASTQAEPRLAVGQLAGAVGTLSAWGEHGPGAPAAAAGAARPRRARTRAGSTARDRVAEFIDAARADHRHAREDRQRGLQPPAPRDRRAVRGADRGRGRQHHDAAEAQPRALRAPRRRSRASCAPAPAWRSRASSASTSATARAWKTEWAFLPQACAAAAVALALGARARRRAAGRRRADAREPRRPARLRARRAGDARAGRSASGKHRAHELVHRAALRGQERG